MRGELIRDTAKRLKIREIRLRRLLKDLGWIDKYSHPTDLARKNGWMVSDERTFTMKHTGQSRTYYATLITPNGQSKLRAILSNTLPSK